MRHTTATSNDGSMEIRLTALADGTTAEVRTPGGVFSGPDHLIEIVDLMDGEGLTGGDGLAGGEPGR